MGERWNVWELQDLRHSKPRCSQVSEVANFNFEVKRTFSKFKDFEFQICNITNTIGFEGLEF